MTPDQQHRPYLYLPQVETRPQPRRNSHGWIWLVAVLAGAALALWVSSHNLTPEQGYEMRENIATFWRILS